MEMKEFNTGDVIYLEVHNYAVCFPSYAIPPIQIHSITLQEIIYAQQNLIVNNKSHHRHLS